MSRSGGGGAPVTPYLTGISSIESHMCRDVSAIAANVAYTWDVSEKIIRPIVITNIRVRYGTSAGNLDVGVYRDNGDGTGTLLGSAGSTVAVYDAGLGRQTFTLTAKVSVTPGMRIRLAVAGNNTGCTLSGLATSSTTGADIIDDIANEIASSFPLPATITWGATPCSKMYHVRARP